MYFTISKIFSEHGRTQTAQKKAEAERFHSPVATKRTRSSSTPDEKGHTSTARERSCSGSIEKPGTPRSQRSEIPPARAMGAEETRTLELQCYETYAAGKAEAADLRHSEVAIQGIARGPDRPRRVSSLRRKESAGPGILEASERPCSECAAVPWRPALPAMTVDRRGPMVPLAGVPDPRGEAATIEVDEARALKNAIGICASDPRSAEDTAQAKSGDHVRRERRDEKQIPTAEHNEGGGRAEEFGTRAEQAKGTRTAEDSRPAQIASDVGEVRAEEQRPSATHVEDGGCAKECGAKTQRGDSARKMEDKGCGQQHSPTADPAVTLAESRRLLESRLVEMARGILMAEEKKLQQLRLAEEAKAAHGALLADACGTAEDAVSADVHEHLGEVQLQDASGYAVSTATCKPPEKAMPTMGHELVEVALPEDARELAPDFGSLVSSNPAEESMPDVGCEPMASSMPSDAAKPAACAVFAAMCESPNDTTRALEPLEGATSTDARERAEDAVSIAAEKSMYSVRRAFMASTMLGDAHKTAEGTLSESFCELPVHAMHVFEPLEGATPTKACGLAENGAFVVLSEPSPKAMATSRLEPMEGTSSGHTRGPAKAAVSRAMFDPPRAAIQTATHEPLAEKAIPVVACEPEGALPHGAAGEMESETMCAAGRESVQSARPADESETAEDAVSAAMCEPPEEAMHAAICRSLEEAMHPVGEEPLGCPTPADTSGIAEDVGSAPLPTLADEAMRVHEREPVEAVTLADAREPAENAVSVARSEPAQEAMAMTGLEPVEGAEVGDKLAPAQDADSAHLSAPVDGPMHTDEREREESATPAYARETAENVVYMVRSKPAQKAMIAALHEPAGSPMNCATRGAGEDAMSIARSDPAEEAMATFGREPMYGAMNIDTREPTEDGLPTAGCELVNEARTTIGHEPTEGPKTSDSLGPSEDAVLTARPEPARPLQTAVRKRLAEEAIRVSICEPLRETVHRPRRELAKETTCAAGGEKRPAAHASTNSPATRRRDAEGQKSTSQPSEACGCAGSDPEKTAMPEEPRIFELRRPADMSKFAYEQRRFAAERALEATKRLATKRRAAERGNPAKERGARISDATRSVDDTDGDESLPERATPVRKALDSSGEELAPPSTPPKRRKPAKCHATPAGRKQPLEEPAKESAGAEKADGSRRRAEAERPTKADSTGKLKKKKKKASVRAMEVRDSEKRPRRDARPQAAKMRKRKRCPEAASPQRGGRTRRTLDEDETTLEMQSDGRGPGGAEARRGRKEEQLDEAKRSGQASKKPLRRNDKGEATQAKRIKRLKQKHSRITVDPYMDSDSIGADAFDQLGADASDQLDEDAPAITEDPYMVLDTPTSEVEDMAAPVCVKKAKKAPKARGSELASTKKAKNASKAHKKKAIGEGSLAKENIRRRKGISHETSSDSRSNTRRAKH